MNNKAVKVFLSVILVLVVVIGGVAIGMTVKNGRQPIEPAAAPVFGKKEQPTEAPTEAPTEKQTETATIFPIAMRA